MSIGLRRGTVVLEEHQAAWEESARETMRLLKKALDGLDVDIQHVGSTAVKSIKAKPIVDLAVAADDYGSILERNAALAELGIVFRLDERPEQLLYAMGDFAADTRTHHIHVVLKESKQWRDYLSFRDYLNENLNAAREYEAVKETLAERYADDREAYTEGKSGIVTKLLREAEEWRSEGFAG